MPQELQLSDGAVANLTEYNIRGWCFFEATVSSVLKPSLGLLDLGMGAAVLDNEGSGWDAVLARACGHGGRARRRPRGARRSSGSGTPPWAGGMPR
mmetsp:Transcript_42331/g.117866  ORF Transcript_42331/g.117866 Transcript_42331/m.117866 type:complete len:96 (-) Transcript_42331:82-369(-)